MQRHLRYRRVSDTELVKDAGLALDFDEIARRGKMSKEEDTIAKGYGVYRMRQKTSHMVRVVLPGGQLTSAQARGLAKVAEDYGQGKVAFTTRQAAQLHWVKLGLLPDLLRDLRAHELYTFHGCGDNARNVAACPWAADCEHARIDVLPWAHETRAVFDNSRDLDNLPRKFKISYSGCGAGCGQPYMNDVGVIALRRQKDDGTEETGFQVVIGGGQGWYPFVSQELYSFVPPAAITAVCRAVGKLFRDHGDRWNRATARLKFVVMREGIDRCRELVDAYLDAEGVDRSAFETAPVSDCGAPWPDRPLAVDDARDHEGLAIQRVMLPKGEIDFRQLLRLAELSERYGDKHLISTNRQNLEIHGVRPEWVAELRDELRQIGLGADGFFGLPDIVPCVGTTYCPLAVSKTHDMYDLLQSVVHQEKYAAIRDKAIVNITGCPNSCSPYRISDIGLRGMRLREAWGSQEGYEIRIGGTEQRYGIVVGEYKNPDCVRVVSAVLDRFCEIREGDESLADNVHRLGAAPYEEAIAQLGIDYDMAAQPQELSQDRGLVSENLDHRTYAKDVPCQAACPAGTRVPQYIEKIAAGDLDGAYRINQEDNVFPGVLGRVCTRPCEPACRHSWTGTAGPVAICHLKRSAADGKAEAPKPLAPWFGASGKRVAIVGTGPAGLAAARELKRYGHDITMFEREAVMGGMMMLSIPHFRLPRDVVREEVQAVIDSGIQVELETEIWHDELAKLRGDYDAVLVAAGAIKSTVLDLPGLPEGVAIGGLDFMKAYNLGDHYALEPPVVVIGGGFTAIDCVRAARRILGLEGGEIGLYYRRTEAQMSANHEEVRQLAVEKIAVETLVSPVGAETDADGKLSGVVFHRNILGEVQEGGKPSIRKMEGSEYTASARTVIFAVGQTRTWHILPEGVELAGNHRTTQDGLFICGDFHTGSLDVIHGVADGKEAAEVIDQYLTGEVRREKRILVQGRDSGETGRVRDHDIVPPPAMPVLPLHQRISNMEVERGYGGEEAHTNAWRCYLCNYKYEIDQDKCIHCDWCIGVSPRECIRRVTRIFTDDDGVVTNYVETTKPKEATFIWIDTEECIRCGNCLRICPTDAISMVRTDPVHAVCGSAARANGGGNGQPKPDPASIFAHETGEGAQKRRIVLLKDQLAETFEV